MGRKLYVGNLSYNVTQSRTSKPCSPTSAPSRAPRSSPTATPGRSKGFGFVEMENESDAMAAIDGLKEHEYDGRRLTVNEAKPREARPATSSYGGGGNRSYGGGGSRRY